MGSENEIENEKLCVNSTLQYHVQADLMNKMRLIYFLYNALNINARVSIDPIVH
jgi:hypothetical protein